MDDINVIDESTTDSSTKSGVNVLSREVASPSSLVLFYSLFTRADSSLPIWLVCAAVGATKEPCEPPATRCT